MNSPSGSDDKESACSVGDPGSIPGSGRSPGERNGNLLLPGEFHGQRSLVGYSSWDHRESNKTERLMHTMPLLYHVFTWIIYFSICLPIDIGLPKVMIIYFIFSVGHTEVLNKINIVIIINTL